MADVNDEKANVQLQKLFPTMVYTFNSKKVIIQEHEKMITDIQDDKNAMTGFENAAELARQLAIPVQSRDDLYNLSSFKTFSSFIENLCGGILNQEGYEYQKIEITNMWANQQSDGSIHPPHSHANSILSGVYYIKTTDKSSGIHFFDPRAQVKCLIPRRKKFTTDNGNIIGYPAKTGTGIVFPSWLMHWTPPNTDERISISWNILVRGNYGEPNTFQNAYI